MPKTFIIIPAYNEGSRIFEVLKGIENSGVLDKVNGTLVVIDDGSSDNTYEQARRSKAVVLQHPINRGQGAALMTGNEYAINHGADYIMHFDADGQHSTDAIEAFINQLAYHHMDMVLGSRFINSIQVPEDIKQKSNLGKILSTVYRGLFKVKNIHLTRRVFLIGNFIVNTFITGVILTDGHNGLRAFTNHTARQLELTQDRYAHPTEYITEIKRLNLKYSEIQVNINYNTTKKSQGFFEALIILKELILGKTLK